MYYYQQYINIFLPFGIIDWLVSLEQLVYLCVSISTFAPNTLCARVVAESEKASTKFSMAILNGELVHECFSRH